MGTFAGLPTRLTPFCPASRCPSPNNTTKPPVRWQARTRGLGDIQLLINYDSYDAVRQALAHAETFITQATGGFFIGTPFSDGISVPVAGVDGVIYPLGCKLRRQ